MTLSRKVAMNTVVHVTGKIVSVAIGVGVIAMMTRYLGAEGFGRYATVVAFLQIFGILIDLGLTLTHVQMLAEPGADKKKIVGAMLGLRIVTAVVFLALAPLVGLLFPYPPVVKLGILVLSASFLFISMQQIFLGVFQDALEMHRVVIAELVGRIVLVSGVAVAIMTQQSLLVILGIIAFGSLVTMLVGWILANGIIPVRPTWDTALSKKILRVSWPIGLSIAFNLLYLKGDTVILSLYRSAEEVGWYGAPFRVLEILISFAFIFVGITFPRLRASWLSDKKRFARQLQKSFDVIAAVTLPLVAGGIVLAHPMMLFIAGPDFTPSGPLMQILILAAGLIFFGTLFGHVIVAIDRQRQMLWGYGATAVVALIGYLIVIPRFGATGAAWMTVAAEGLVTAIMLAALFAYTTVRFSLTALAKAAMASVLMTLLLLALPGFHVLVLVCIGVLSYAVLAVLLRIISIAQLRSFIRNQ